MLLYIKDEEGLDDIDTAYILRDLWNCKNEEIGYLLDWYEKEKANERY